MAILVSVLVADVGENWTVCAVVVNVDALVEPWLFRLEAGLCKIGDVDEAAVGAFHLNIANFNLRRIRDFRRVCRRTIFRL